MRKEKSLKVLGCGALNLDIIYEVEDLEAIRSEGWPLFPGREISGSHEDAEKLVALLEQKGSLLAKSGGGSAANTICALSALGHKGYFLGIVGEDVQGETVLNSMKGVDPSFIEKKGRTAICIVVLEQKSRDRAMFVAPSAYLPKKAQRDVKHYLQNFDLIHFSSLVHDQGIEFQSDLAKLQTSQQLVSLDPGELYATKGFHVLKDLLSKISLLFITTVEVEMMTNVSVEAGLDQILPCLLPKRAMQEQFVALKEGGGALVACKKGAEGACFVGVNGVKYCEPAQKLDHIVDNTGAGDGFNAGFIDGLLKGNSPQACLRSGVQLAAKSLLTFGREYLTTLHTKG